MKYPGTTSGQATHTAFVAKSVTCKTCGGSRYVLVRSVNKPQTTNGWFYIVCPDCGGLGYTAETIDTNKPDAPGGEGEG